jgi:acetylornithine deacetylase/succinyl-diaminopimelate desuccinylase-like protein
MMQDLIVEKVIQRAIEIQQIPAPTFEEHERAEFVRAKFEKEGLDQVSIDSIGNVFACLPGGNGSPPVVVSAHTDTIFPTEVDLTLNRTEDRISGPGIGDNSLGVAGLFGLLWELRRQDIQLPGDLWLAANVGEEGLGDLVGMKKVIERFGDNPLGYIVLEGLAFGRLYHRGLGVRRYRISVETVGGHSWVDYGNPSAIHELSVVMGDILSLRIPYRRRTSINIGKISGGVSINTIAPHASLDLDLRSESGRVLEMLSRKVENIVHLAKRPGVKFTCEVIGNREFGEIPPDHPLVQIGIDAISRQDVEPELLIGSTDANVPLSKGIPAICIGISNGGGAHTIEEYISPDFIQRGVKQLVDVVVNAYKLAGK